MERKKQAEVRSPVKKLHFDSNLPGLLEEVLNNQTCAILKIPINITRSLLSELAQLAIEIDDPRLHLMMIRLGLYDFNDGGDRVRQRDEMDSLVKEYEERGDHRITWNTPGLRAFLKREAAFTELNTRYPKGVAVGDELSIAYKTLSDGPSTMKVVESVRRVKPRKERNPNERK